METLGHSADKYARLELAVVHLHRELGGYARASFSAASCKENFVAGSLGLPVAPKVIEGISRYASNAGKWSRLLAPSRAGLREHKAWAAADQPPPEVAGGAGGCI